MTPESITYLNESIKKRTSKLDEELVYAGLHSEKVKGLKFTRTEKVEREPENLEEENERRMKYLYHVKIFLKSRLVIC